jgi:DNA polymerase
MDPALAAELASIVAAARAHVEREIERGAHSVPLASSLERLAAVAREAAPQATARASAAPASRAAAPAHAAPAPVHSSASIPSIDFGDAQTKRDKLNVLAESAATCTACVLHEKRTQAVFARGNPDAELVFVGEGPGAEEDRLGEPFVGPAGQLLDRMIAAMGYARDEVYICNIVKCRPPDNRTPRPEEGIACSRYLTPQLELVQPKLIVALGRCAAENLGVARAEGAWRGRFGAYRGITVMPTYHPAYLLRSPEQKRVVWDDLKLALERLGRTPPPPRKAGA